MSSVKTVTVTIDSVGSVSPAVITVHQGDTVSWVSGGPDVVLCIDKAAYFGGNRFEIPSGQTLDLTVQSPPIGGFNFIIQIGDLDAYCDEAGWKAATGRGRGDP